MTAGELIFANVVDQRVWDAHGDQGTAGIYLAGRPGRALPFTLYRAWKIGAGMVSEEIRLCPGIVRTSTSMFLREVIPYRTTGLLDG